MKEKEVQKQKTSLETHCLLEYGALNIKFINIPTQIRYKFCGLDREYSK
jgi:hypothetical protein